VTVGRSGPVAFTAPFAAATAAVLYLQRAGR
jgi:hypothetical protein